MKRRVFVMAGLLMFLSMVTTQVARAEQPMTVNVPFAFVAGNTTLPAGEYRVEKLDNSAVVLIRCSEASAATMVITIAAEASGPQSHSKLIFNRYGDRYFLSQVWTEGSVRGRELPKSRREKELLQAATTETKDQVILLARLAPTPR